MTAAGGGGSGGLEGGGRPERSGDGRKGNGSGREGGGGRRKGGGGGKEEGGGGCIEAATGRREAVGKLKERRRTGKKLWGRVGAAERKGGGVEAEWETVAFPSCICVPISLFRFSQHKR